MHETLDETIDRVAGELSAVAGDPTMTAHVRERMHERRRPWVMPALAAATVAGAVVVAIAWMSRVDETLQSRALTELSAVGVAPFAALRGAVESSAMALRVGRIPAPVGGPSSGESLQESAILADVAAQVGTVAPQDAPASLGIEELSVPPLSWPESVEIAALEVVPLEVLRLDRTDDLKEPK